MDLAALIESLQGNPPAAVFTVIILAAAAFAVARYGLARWFMDLSQRTETQVDDILVRYVRFERLAWLVPLLVVYAMALLFPASQGAITRVALLLIVWLSALSLLSLILAINTIYESRPGYNGVSIGGYLDIAKLVILFVAVILSISMLTNRSPAALLTGLGAMAAVLMLIFQDTILALVASIQIAANGLLKEGDWVEVPAYNAEGDVVNINLHTIKVRNADMTYSIIPTHKIMDVSYRNYRGIVESGGRRIERSILLDQMSISFCNLPTLYKLQRIDLLADWLAEKIRALEAYVATQAEDYDWPLDGPQVTNTEVYREYIAAYLRSRTDIFTEDKPFIVRALAPTPSGLPIQLYVFVRTTDWATFEMVQGQIFDHLMAAVSVFDLRVFQEPTGLDFRQLGRGRQVSR